MTTVALLLALFGAAEIRLGDRTDAAIVVLTPFGPSQTGTSRLVAAASAAFEEETDLRLLPAQQIGIDVDRMIACPADTRLTCWVSLFSESKTKLLLIVTVIASSTGDSVAMTMIDLGTTVPMLGASDSERRIFESIVEVRARAMSDPEAAFRAVVAEELRPYLAARGHFRPFGEMSIETDCEGCSLVVNAEEAGALRPGATRIEGLRPGTIELAVVRGSETLCREQLQIRAGELSAATCSVQSFDPNDAVLYAGAAAAALGAIGIVWSAILLAEGPEQVCLDRARDQCDFALAARTGYGGGGPAAPLSNDGVPILQIGGGLFTAGAAWVAGGASFDRRWWWITLASGVALGALSGGLLFLLE